MVEFSRDKVTFFFTQIYRLPQTLEFILSKKDITAMLKRNVLFR